MTSVQESESEIPGASQSRTAWFLNQVRDSYLNEPGAYISERVFLSSQVWHMSFLEPKVTKLLKERTKLLSSLARIRASAPPDDRTISKLEKEVAQVFRLPIGVQLDNTSALEHREEQLFTPRRQVKNWFKSTTSGHGRGSVGNTQANVISTSTTNTVISGGADTPADFENPNSSASLFFGATKQLKASDTRSLLSGDSSEGSIFSGGQGVSSLHSSFGRVSLRSVTNKEAEVCLAGYAGAIGELAHLTFQEDAYGGAAEQFAGFVTEVVAPRIITDVFDLLQMYMDHNMAKKLLSY